jgi:predicted P-loop ATPase
MADINGRAARGEGSCVIDMKGPKAGWWRDFATGQGGQPLSTLKEGSGLEGQELFELAAQICGGDYRINSPHYTKRQPKKNGSSQDHNAFAKREWNDGVEVRNSLVETYLAARLIALPDHSDFPLHENLRFNPMCADRSVNRARPTWILRFRDAFSGEPTGGIHRIYLKDDGSGHIGKENGAKKSLGTVSDPETGAAGVVMLGAPGPGGDLAIGEGLESTLAAVKLLGIPTDAKTGLPCWAATSTAEMQAIASGLREGKHLLGAEGLVKRVLVLADGGKGGIDAARALVGAAMWADIDAKMIEPKGGDDFADDLAQGLWTGAPAIGGDAVTIDPPAPASPTSAPSYNDLLAQANALMKLAEREGEIQRASAILRDTISQKFPQTDEIIILDIVKRKTGIPGKDFKNILKELRKEIFRGRATANAGAALGPISLGARDNWENDLIRSEISDMPLPIQANVVVALMNAPELSGHLWFNNFSLKVEVKGDLPWDKQTESRDWEENDHYSLITWCQIVPLINANGQIVKGAVHQAAHFQEYDPLLDFIDGLTWDGKSRLDDWVVRILGCDDTKLNRAYGRKFLIAMVRRARHPGAKSDNVLIFYGDEGLGKSSIFRALAEPYFTDDIADLGSKDASMQMCGIWLVEMSDLETLSRAEGVRANAFFSRSSDRFRPPYGQFIGDHPRRSLICGTTNEKEVLRHATGLRRYWIIEVTKADVEQLKQERDQLMAEAAFYENKGEQHWLENDLISEQREDAKSHRTDDPWIPIVREWIEGKTEGLKAEGFSVHEVLEFALEVPKKDMSRTNEMRVAQVLKDLGFTKKVHTDKGNKWQKP